MCRKEEKISVSHSHVEKSLFYWHFLQLIFVFGINREQNRKIKRNNCDGLPWTKKKKKLACESTVNKFYTDCLLVLYFFRKRCFVQQGRLRKLLLGEKQQTAFLVAFKNRGMNKVIISTPDCFCGEIFTRRQQRPARKRPAWKFGRKESYRQSQSEVVMRSFFLQKERITTLSGKKNFLGVRYNRNY